jgi:isopentenyl-diphosphate delta-isomerase
MKIPIVNENDEIIGYRDRSDRNNELIYRVSALYIEDTKGNMLLARRSLTKKHDPGKWGPAVAGTVEEGETYESNIIKEAEEEIGLKNFTFQVGDKKRMKGRYNYFAQEFNLVLPEGFNDFKIDKTEVEEIRWFSVEELKYLIEESPDEFLRGIKSKFDYENKN